MNTAELQRRLAARGFDPGPRDGLLGRRTLTALFDWTAGCRVGATTESLALEAVRQLPRFGIGLGLRLAHFLAQASAETGGFRHLREIWGPTRAQLGYEGRADLGNCQPGDGRRYCGRGIFQITGRDNYLRYGQRLGHDLVAAPGLAARPDISLRIACLYWDDHELNAWADRDDLLAVSRGINRGNPKSRGMPNGMEHRSAALERAREVLL